MSNTTDNRPESTPVTRRSLLAAGAAIGAGASVVAAASKSAKAEDGHEMHKGHHNGPVKNQAVIDAALHCVNRGEVCVEHCIGLLGSGDTSLKACLQSVSAMLSMCATLAKFTALDSKRLKQLAKVCIDVCSDCEEECKKHQDKHAACKACAQSCAACIKECKKLTKA